MPRRAHRTRSNGSRRVFSGVQRDVVEGRPVGGGCLLDRIRIRALGVEQRQIRGGRQERVSGSGHGSVRVRKRTAAARTRRAQLVGLRLVAGASGGDGAIPMGDVGVRAVLALDTGCRASDRVGAFEARNRARAGVGGQDQGRDPACAASHGGTLREPRPGVNRAGRAEPGGEGKESLGRLRAFLSRAIAGKMLQQRSRNQRVAGGRWRSRPEAIRSSTSQRSPSCPSRSPSNSATKICDISAR